MAKGSTANYSRPIEDDDENPDGRMCGVADRLFK